MLIDALLASHLLAKVAQRQTLPTNHSVSTKTHLQSEARENIKGMRMLWRCSSGAVLLNE